MLKYFSLFFILTIVLVLSVWGFRGGTFWERPLRIFPDMDEQDKLKSQKPSDLFADGMGARRPVAGTVPQAGDDGVFSVEFGEGRTGYYYTGQLDGYFGEGLPLEELGVEEGDVESMRTLIRRGEDRYKIYCAVCHGASGNGKGTVAQYEGFPQVANLHMANFLAAEYPDGRMYDVITNGKGNMSGYGYNIPVRDRWAIVSYVRALQEAQKEPAKAEEENPQEVEQEAASEEDGAQAAE